MVRRLFLHRKAALGALICGLIASCTSTSTPAAPSAASPNPAPATYTISGALTATNGGQPLDGASIDIGGVSTQTNASGQYTVTAPASSVALALTIHVTDLL